MEVFEKLAELRRLYPEDIERIEADERRLSALLDDQEYYLHPGTQNLVKLCRDEIKQARLKLATVRTLTQDAIRELWTLVEAREWVLRTVARDFDTEIAQLQSEIDAELERGL